MVESLTLPEAVRTLFDLLDTERVGKMDAQYAHMTSRTIDERPVASANAHE